MNQWMDFFSEIQDYSNCKTVSGGDLYTWDTSKLDLENLVTSSVSRSNKIDFYIFRQKSCSSINCQKNLAKNYIFPLAKNPVFQLLDESTFRRECFSQEYVYPIGLRDRVGLQEGFRLQAGFGL